MEVCTNLCKRHYVARRVCAPGCRLRHCKKLSGGFCTRVSVTGFFGLFTADAQCAMASEDLPGAPDDGVPAAGGDPAAGMDPAMMQKLMAAMGQGKDGEGGGMDMSALQAMMGSGGMGGMGGPSGAEGDMQRKSQANQQDHAAKNAGEEEGGDEGKKFKWEQTSAGGESTILVRFPLAAKATKRDVKVVFKAKELKVTVHGDELMAGKTYGVVSVDDSTWCIGEEGRELQVLLAPAQDTKWQAVLKD